MRRSIDGGFLVLNPSSQHVAKIYPPPEAGRLEVEEELKLSEHDQMKNGTVGIREGNQMNVVNNRELARVGCMWDPSPMPCHHQSCGGSKRKRRSFCLGIDI